MDPVPTPPEKPVASYGAFISYRHVDPDRREAIWLHRALEAWRTPKGLVALGAPPRLQPVFRDEDELHASAHLSPQLDAALASSRWLIVVCSPRTPTSPWVEREIQRFRELGGNERILALLIDGTPRESFPAGLQDAATGMGTEPFAADPRPAPGVSAATARQSALLRLLAPMLGVRFDDLRQRDLERRTRRLRALSLAAAAALLLVGALAFTAVRAEQRASRLDRELQDHQQRLFQALLNPALAGSAHLEILADLVGKIGGRSSDRTAQTLQPADLLHEAATLLATSFLPEATADPRGALEAQNEALAALAGIPPDGPVGERAALLRIEVLRASATTLKTLGRMEQALARARQAVELARAALKLHPDDPAARRLLAVTLTTLGLLAPAAHAVAEARTALEEAVTLLEGLRVAAADALPARIDLCAARRNLSRALTAQGDTAGALREARAAAALLGPADEDDPLAAAQQAESLDHLAGLLNDGATVRDAADTQRAVIALRERAVARDPGNDGSQLELYVAQRRLAPILERLGQTAEANAQVSLAVAGLVALRARAPDNVEVLDEWAVVLMLQAEVLGRRGLHTDALALSGQALEALGALRAAGKADRLRRRHEVQFLLSEADILQKVPDRAAQRRNLERALSLADELAREDPEDADLIESIVHARLELVLVLLKVSSGAEALAMARQTVAQAEARLAKAPTETGRLALAGLAQDRLGRVLAHLAQPEPALDAFREASVLFARRHALDGGSAAAGNDLAIAHMHIGDALYDQGRYSDALVSFRAGQDVLPAPASNPADATLSRKASHLGDRVARCLGRLEQFTASATAFEEAAKLQETALSGGAGDPRMALQMRDNASRMRRLARADELIGKGQEPADADEALAMAHMLSLRQRLEESLPLFEKALAGAASEEMRIHSTLSAAETAVELAGKQPEKALALHQKALGWLREHVELTRAKILRLEAEAAAVPRERRGHLESDVRGLRQLLEQLQHKSLLHDALHDTPEFEAIFAPPPGDAPAR